MNTEYVLRLQKPIMKIFIATSLLLVASVPAVAQEILPGRISINQAIRRELTMGSIPADTSLRSSPPDYYAQPLVFHRTSGEFKPYATVRYFFSRIDSLPFKIEYRWDANGHLQERERYVAALQATEPMSRLAQYNAHYQSLWKEIVSEYGKPSWVASEKPGRVMTDRGNYFWGRNDRWEQEGRTVEMFLYFADSTSPGGYEIGVNQVWGE